MTTPINDGVPAYPTVDANRELDYGTRGMTTRDYFAAAAMQGICASRPTADFTDAVIAREAYNLADAMIKARSA